jgi:hypothetical protein
MTTQTPASWWTRLQRIVEPSQAAADATDPVLRLVLAEDGQMTIDGRPTTAHGLSEHPMQVHGRRVLIVGSQHRHADALADAVVRCRASGARDVGVIARA